jgi:hypothetical protein
MGALTRTDQIDALPEKERDAYFKHIQRGDAPASPDLNARLLKMYLMGKSLDEIQRTNKTFTLGMMVQAKLEGQWDERKLQYQTDLLDKVQERVKQTQLEAIHFASDQLGLAHAKFRERMSQYLETGDESVFQGMVIGNMKDYREYLSLLRELTGQDSTKSVKHTHKVEKTEPEEKTIVVEAKVVPTNVELLALLDAPEGK